MILFKSIKKVGSPALVSIKKCAKQFSIKKAGLHPIGIISLIVIFLSTLPDQCVQACPTPESITCQSSFSRRPSPTCSTSSPSTRTATAALSWSQGSSSINKLIRMINGNGRKGYNIGLWNCRRALITADKSSSTKKVEVQQFIEKKNLHVLCVVEADLHSPISRYRTRHPLSTEDIENILGIPGFRIIVPKSWVVLGQAGVMVYAREFLQVKIRDVGLEYCDLPTISMEIGLGRERKTIINYFYREFTSGVSGLDDTQSQIERLSRQIRHWRARMLYAWGMQTSAQ